MRDTTKPGQHSPADIAREAFRRLAARRIAPTPDAYREIYDEVAGSRGQSPAERMLAELAAGIEHGPADLAQLSRRIGDALKARDWESCGRQLAHLVEKHLIAPTAPKAGDPHAAAKIAIDSHATSSRPSIPLVDEIAPLPEKKIPIPLVDAIAPPRARSISIPLVDAEPASEQTVAEPVAGMLSHQFNDTQLTRMLRDMLVRTLTLPIPALLQRAQALTAESESLAGAIGSARSRQALAELEPRFKHFCFMVEMESGDVAEERELLLRLFRLLIENIGELVDDDSWLRGQIDNVQDILAGPVNYASLLDATRSLKEVIYKQSLLKHSLAEARGQVKEMMLATIDRVGVVASNTEDYRKKIEDYSEKISRAQGIGDLNQVMDALLRDTRSAQEDTLRIQHDMLTTRQEVQAAEGRIQELETQLQQMSELAHEDQLTGSLNRRGLDEVLEREMARAARKQSPLCVALLDLDDFKKLNDTHGHSAGDGALIHLVHVVKTTLRTMDVIARFGGEEFLIVLPHTPVEEAMQTVTRVQRELTKQIFMHNNQRLLITFSSGVALWDGKEGQAEMIARADEALYKAKKAGKNRVVPAD